MGGKTWKKVDTEMAKKIKFYLQKNDGIEKDTKGIHDDWRIGFSDVLLTLYSNGTLYSTESVSQDPVITEAWDYIDGLLGSRYAKPSKDLLIGFDETGKGELFGHTVLAGAILPGDIFATVDKIIGSADTKKKHLFNYWDDLFQKFDHLKNRGLRFHIETIPPWEIDKFNINKIMDITYQRILNVFYRDIDMSKARIVIDNYSIGKTLERFLNMLTKKGAEIIVKTDAESSYLEVKLASLLAKRYSQRSIEEIRKNPEFQIKNINIGSGNAGDPKTMNWLIEWKNSGKDWPWFVKKSFKTVRELDGKPKETKKQPPLNQDLLSKEFLKNFNNGKISVQSLSVVCPHCGLIMKSIRIIFRKEGEMIISRLICNEGCRKVIADAGSTLRYYCGFLIPDNNAVSKKIIGGDLKSTRIFENFTVILSPVVRFESDKMRGANQEINDLRRFSNKGRISIESPGNLNGIKLLNNTERDERYIQDCIHHNAILLTADKKLAAFAVGKGIFTITA